ncbi:hypothetical protein NDU88_001008 [Pleurodeles waltl]|uniref:RING finger protein 37 n=1 Tax=Pleurodeles waltl TaxID=8319 RepID=A0AAV7WKN1_PLEWA|nr:hypothetical protein NDU88_001008 [Pleurodeles waltl]
MVINLCLPQFSPNITCNKVCADGYEVENLISEDIVKRNRGFRCEYFIRPPVHVTITFPFNIDISTINVDVTSSGGNQHFTELEIFTTSTSKSTLNSQGNPFPGVSNQSSSEKDVYKLVGKALLKNPYRAIFHNRGFKARPPFHHTQPPFPNTEFVSFELWNKGPFSLNNVTHLKISISHLAGGGLLCIKTVEVWGQPARSCPQALMDSVLQIASESLPQAIGSQDPASPMESNCMSDSNSDIAQQILQELDIHDVPEEFLDPITLEVMTLPMLLPSGKVIDQSTLEKCNRSEASWGRMPSDPFTGVTYNHHSQPVPHPTLKARIDLFLLQHGIPGSNILGRAQARAIVAPSSITLPSLKRKLACMEQSVNNSNCLEPSCFTAPNSLVMSTSETCAKKMKTDCDIGVAQMDCSAVPACHEQRLSQSLDMALTSALSSMPSFTSKLPRGPQQLATDGGLSSISSWVSSTLSDPSRSSGVQGCSSCSRTFSAYSKTEAVYQLPCGHLMCRACLSEKQRFATVVCLSCKRSASSRDIQRVHF